METIENIYNKIINNGKWRYYNNEDLKNLKFDELFNDDNKSYTFIINMIIESGKIADQLKKCLDALKTKENAEGEDRRLRHIVSLFFLGFAIYENIQIIKKGIDEQIEDLGILHKEFSSSKRFAFIWFLLCIFHDLGYAYERKLVKEPGQIVKVKMPTGFIPSKYTKENIDRYDKYRQCKWNVKDHGIWGGKVFYSEMIAIGKKIAENQRNNEFKIFETENVGKLYQYAAWIIMCHNINYNTNNDDYTNCYRCQKLDDFILSKARCISIKNNPLLFLFCFADTIEPTKKLHSKTHDPQKDKLICNSLKLEFKDNSMKFVLDDDYGAFGKYKDCLLEMNEWLIDVDAKDLSICFE
jgi:hypothetical protein